MKNLIVLLSFFCLGFMACDRNNHIGCAPVPKFESNCIQTKINALIAENKGFTSVTRYEKENGRFWLFNNGAAFDAPQYMLNAACDTVCTWAFRANASPCQKDFNLNDSTAVVIWKK